MQPENQNPEQPIRPSGPPPAGPMRQDFSRPVDSFARRPAAPAPRPMDGFRPPSPAPQQPVPSPTPQPQPQPFRPPQPSPGFTPPAPQPSQPAPAPTPQPTQSFIPSAPSQPASPGFANIPPRPMQPAAPPQATPDAGIDRDMEAMRSDSLLGTTGSKIIPEKKKVPKGIYVLAGLAAIGFGASFFDSSQTSLVYTVLLLANLLVVVGLFLRMEVARKIAFWIAIATVGLNLLLAGFFFMSVKRAEKLETDFIAAAKKAQEDNPQNTPQEQEMLDHMQHDVEAASDALGELESLFYAKVGITALAYAGVALYLTRPKVKAAFQTEEKALHNSASI